jgi:hypothetical protein
LSQEDIHVVSADVSADEFESLFQALCRWGRWGDDDDRGRSTS